MSPNFDTYAFYESAAKNGMSLVAAAAGHKKGVVSGDNIEITTPGRIFRGECISAAIANAVQFKVGKNNDVNQALRSRAGFIRDQTDICRQLGICDYPVKAGEILNGYADNGNNAQVECILFMVSNGDSIPQFSDKPIAPIPPGAFTIDLIGGTAAVAGTWTPSATTTSAILERNAIYKILAFGAQSATMYACALESQGKSDQVGFYPGVPGGDLPGEAVLWYSDSWPTFEGANLPKLVPLCSGTDAAQYGTALIIKVG